MRLLRESEIKRKEIFYVPQSLFWMLKSKSPKGNLLMKIIMVKGSKATEKNIESSNTFI